MSITMTIEVTPEQAIKIADILRSTPVQPATPAPAAAPVQTQPVPVVPTAMPRNVPAAPVQAYTTSTQAPVQAMPAMPQNAAAAPIQTVAMQTVPAQAAPIPTAVKEYTPDELSLACRPLVESGRQQDVLNLLHSFTYTDRNGVAKIVQNINEMPRECYPAFANGIRDLGGRI